MVLRLENVILVKFFQIVKHRSAVTSTDVRDSFDITTSIIKDDVHVC